MTIQSRPKLVQEKGFLTPLMYRTWTLVDCGPLTQIIVFSEAIRKTKKAAVNIMVSWSASMIWATLPLLGWSRYILDRTGLWCHIQWEDPDLASNTFLLLTVSALFIFPTTLQGICYFRVRETPSLQYTENVVVKIKYTIYINICKQMLMMATAVCGRWSRRKVQDTWYPGSNNSIWGWNNHNLLVSLKET